MARGRGRRTPGLRREEVAHDPTNETQLFEGELSSRLPTGTRQFYELLGSGAAKFPAVETRLRLAKAETLLELADKVPDQRDQYLDQARAIYDGLQASEMLESEVEAGIYTGLGDITYLSAGADPAQLAAARENYLRVVVLFPEEAAYVPKAMAFAALASSKLATGDALEVEQDRAKRLARRVISRYPGSRWVEIARAALR